LASYGADVDCPLFCETRAEDSTSSWFTLSVFSSGRSTPPLLGCSLPNPGALTQFCDPPLNTNGYRCDRSPFLLSFLDGIFCRFCLSSFPVSRADPSCQASADGAYQCRCCVGGFPHLEALCTLLSSHFSFTDSDVVLDYFSPSVDSSPPPLDQRI